VANKSLDKTIHLELTPKEEAKLYDAISKCVAEIKRARRAMKKDQVEIERLKAETRSMLAQLKASWLIS
jgi:nitrogen fixation/metabolism regulation signal transduction histidine kinase